MKNFLPVLQKDFYKVGHKFQYPKDTTLIYSNLTPRDSRLTGVKGAISFAFQYMVQDFLIEQFRDNFFNQDRDLVVKQYKRRVDNALGPGTDVSHIGELHELGYLPLHIKAVPEGIFVPLRVPMMTIRNTDPKFFWLTNMLETVISSYVWHPIVAATIAFQYRKVFNEYAKKTGGDPGFTGWQGHDFSERGLDAESVAKIGAAHLLSFTGTDTITAIDFLETYYGANSDTELIGGSVPATEHSVMCMGGKGGELETIKRLITEVYPKGIVSIVCDTWDFWKVITEYLPALKSIIMARDGKVVVRPDSGDPVKIICGDMGATYGTPEYYGAIKMLHKTFGGTQTSEGFIQLDPHVGLIYGDSITPERQVQILDGLMYRAFASTNVVLGIGSYTYQCVTRDTLGLAMKATYGETLSGGPQAIFKAPKTDNGIKNSAKGLLQVYDAAQKGLPELGLRIMEDCTWEEEAGGVLQDIFLNGLAKNPQTLKQIRARIEAQL